MDGVFVACIFMCTSRTLNKSRVHINVHFACKELKTCLSVGEAQESSFYHCRLRVKLVWECLSTRNDCKSSFHRCRSPVNLCKYQKRSTMQFSPLWKSCEACLSGRKCRESCYTTLCGSPVKHVYSWLNARRG